jgi:hypothetical protein
VFADYKVVESRKLNTLKLFVVSDEIWRVLVLFGIVIS